jgi:hypothetical protein
MIAVRLAARPGEDQDCVVEVGFFAKIQGSTESPRPPDEGDGAAVGQTPERLLQGPLVAAGLDGDVDASTARCFLQLEPDVLVQRVEGCIAPESMAARLRFSIGSMTAT